METRINPEQVSHIQIYDATPLKAYYRPNKIEIKWFGLYTNILQKEGYYETIIDWYERFYCSVEYIKEQKWLFDKDGEIFESPYILIFSGGKSIKIKHFKTVKQAKEYCTKTFPQRKHYYMIKLIRVNDNREWTAKDYRFISFDEEGRAVSMDKSVGVGKSLMLPPYSAFFTWQTTPIKAFAEYEGGIEFGTMNSSYRLEFSSKKDDI